MSQRANLALITVMALSGCVAEETYEGREVVDAEQEAAAGERSDAVGELKAEQQVAKALEAPAALLVSSAEEWTYLLQPGPSPYMAGDCNVPSSDWSEPGFVVDDWWAAGLAELGYGDGDEQTVINAGPSPKYKCISQYFRHEFHVDDISRFKSLILRLLVDDGAVVYLNGYEIARHNLPPGYISPTTPAKSAVSGSAEDKYTEFKWIPIEHLVSGINVLAVEVHQYSQYDADLSFNAELLAALDPSDPELETYSFGSWEATIDESQLNVRLGGDSACKVDGASGEDNADKSKEQVCLAQWNLTMYDLYNQQIPPDSKVVAAHIVTKVVNTSPDSYQLFPVETPWVESKVTWNDPNGELNGDWYTGKFSPADLETHPVSSVNAPYKGTRIIPLPARLVQQWLDDPSSNQGLAFLNFWHVDGIDFSAAGNGLELVLRVAEDGPTPNP